jgi:hypothetical protein
MTEIEATVARQLAAYDGLGILRAGTDADRRAALWLAAQANGEVVPVPFSRFVPGEAWIEVVGRRLDGLPLFDAPPGEVSGPLGPAGGEAAIGWQQVAPAGASLKGQAVEALRRGAAHKALVLVPHARHGSLAPLNAPNFQSPFGPPVLQLPAVAAAVLRAAEGQQAWVRTEATREPAETFNVVVDLPGPPAPPLVVITPRTSWWHSVSERGGGIVAWLAALEAVRKAPRRRPALFVATGAHELGHLGLSALFERRPDLADAGLWIHLGANLGAAGEPRTTIRGNVPDVAARAIALLGAAAERGEGAGGEAHDVMRRGGKFVSFIGANPLFHAPEDRWPLSVDLPAAARIAAAAAALAVEAAG